ncbi:chromatin binding protein [Coemansia thaxteri]|uniref:Chromatin binding protein n=1 Tax=Coemansia thaxteri TaxID=2663907 RepID=A0A9W8BLK5_9FUNG|nr:chromatin binding protein [Coemansia thaxteri]KAJ2006197.1 chromatin binding protein [Coemansia thaxteri]KAJ2466705.1 chromatin binding protein [Coemansia sp. RSA 2322]KAJ2486636.1 chromatin binding protein [Coemansia sp. RSA 2320]
MNRKLLDPFAPEYPEAIEACLDDEYAVKCSFSHHGSLLATARSDGWCYIWDMDTLNVMRRLLHGESALTGVSWSRSGRYILTFDGSGVCILWDLRTTRQHARVVFDSAIVSARIHPRNSFQFVVCPAREAPCLVTVDRDTEAVSPRIEHIRIAADGVDVNSKAAASTCCCFGKRGTHVLFGTSKGAIHAVHVATRAVVCSIKLSGSTVNTIARNPRGTDIVANSSDRILRVCEVNLPNETQSNHVSNTEPSITVVTKITDSVNRVSWLQAVFSSSGDYIVAGIDHKAEHNMYIWDKTTSSLVKMLTGPNELLEDCAVHPLRPIYASISTFGIIYLWTRVPQQNWNAFAPGFRELEENIDYFEPEDAYDRRVATENGEYIDCAESRARRERRTASGSDEEDQDEQIDIIEDDPLFSDSDSDSDDEGFVLPVILNFEDDELPLAVPPPASKACPTAENDQETAMDVDQGYVIEAP